MPPQKYNDDKVKAIKKKWAADQAQFQHMFLQQQEAYTKGLKLKEEEN